MIAVGTFKRVAVFIGIGAIASVMGCVPSQTVQDQGRLVLNEGKLTGEASVGEKIEIVLASNPTTGFSWALAERDSLKAVTLLKNEYVREETGRAGSGGTEHWHFAAASPGEAVITFAYERPWETNVAPAKTVEFKIHVAQ